MTSLSATMDVLDQELKTIRTPKAFDLDIETISGSEQEVMRKQVLTTKLKG